MASDSIINDMLGSSDETEDNQEPLDIMDQILGDNTKNPSTLVKAAQKATNKIKAKQEGEEEPEEGEEEKKPEKKEEKKEDDAQEDETEDKKDDVEEILLTKSGNKASKQVTEFIKKQKAKIAELEEKVKSGTGSIDPQLTEKATKYDEVIKERDEYKAKIDRIAYQESPEFKDTFVEPLKQARSKIQSVVDVPQDELEDAKALFSKAGQYAGKDISKFLGVVDEIIDAGFVTGNSKTRLFTKYMEDWHETAEKYITAVEEKENDSKSVVASESRAVRSKHTQEIHRDIDTFVETFKADSRLKINALEGKDKERYMSFVQASSKTKEDINDFAATGKMTKSLVETIQQGLIAETLRAESDIIRKGWVDTQNKNKILSDQVKELQDKIDILSGNGKRGSSNGVKKKAPVSDDDSEEDPDLKDMGFYSGFSKPKRASSAILQQMERNAQKAG